jgi:hypothetical protein
MKYVVMEVKMPAGSKEFPIIFPDVLIHADVANKISLLLISQFPGWKNKPISAGFIPSLSLDELVCIGRSESLNLDSRGEIDEQLMFMSDHGAGENNG